jgi:L-gulonolactone oxidase
MFATFLFLLLSAAPALAVPPRPPARCGDDGCVLSNAYGAWSSDRADCPVSAVTYPASEREVVAAVARASAGGTRVKVVSGFAHTIPKLACPGGGGNGTTLLISTARLAGVEVDAAAGTVSTDAGAPLRDVIDAVEARGLSLVAAPYWEGVSVGGLVATGSHGSSWWGRGGAVHDHVVELRLVVPASEGDSWAKVLALKPGDELFPAALVSLGLLGVVSKVSDPNNSSWSICIHATPSLFTIYLLLNPFLFNCHFFNKSVKNKEKWSEHSLLLLKKEQLNACVF